MPNLRTPITRSKATEIKSLLWQGIGQAKVCVLTGVSQSSISRIKDGTIEPDAIWPNGAQGPMPPRGMALEEGWSDEATEYMRLPEEMQVRVLALINEQREIDGDEPIPHTAPEYAEFLRMSASDRAFEQTSIAEARLCEDRRMGQIMVQWVEILTIRRSAREDVEIQRILDGTEQEVDLSQTYFPPTSGELVYTKMPWDRVLHKAHKVTIVQIADTLDRIALKEACCIMIHELRGSPDNWKTPAVEEQIYLLADKLEGYPEIMERLEKEYSPTVPIRDDTEG